MCGEKIKFVQKTFWNILLLKKCKSDRTLAGRVKVYSAENKIKVKSSRICLIMRSVWVQNYILGLKVI
jgi:hypothetical protein